MKCIAPHPRRGLTTRRGFALIVTLSLMILLLVVAVGLLGIAGISLRSSQLSGAQQTARANARMAMVIAIGQLQSHAGTDQRVTASADIAAGPRGDPAADAGAPTNLNALDGQSKGVSAVQAGTRFWTGIWKNRDVPGLIYTKTPSPQLLQWLVSGNEITPATNTPATPANGLKADGSPADRTKTVLLVGPRSAGNRTTDISKYVTAPLVDVYGTGTTPKKTGRYGWWVGDEGVKAKINIVPPYAANNLTTYKTVTSQRSGWEVVAGFDKYPIPGAPDAASLDRVLTLPQLSLIGNGAIPGTSLSFHSATTDTMGVLADSLQGGLRLDLSSYLRQPLPATAPAPYPNAIQINKNIIPAALSATIKGPKWNVLNDFNDFAATNVTAGTLNAKPATSDFTAAIAPTIVELRLLLGAKLVPATAVDQYKVYPCAKIAVTLANPYSYPLSWTGLDLELKNALPNDNIQMSRLWPAAGQPAFIPRSPSEAALFNNVIFRIPSGNLPAGGARAYTISSQVSRPANSTSQAVVTLSAISGSPTEIQDFKRVLIMEHGSINSIAGASRITLDVREASVTSQINLELRPQGSAAILRKIERLELDNAEFTPTQRVFASQATAAGNSDIKDPKTFTEPFPLQLFSFQLSQPGVDYGSLLPSSSDIGLRSSTLRTYADFNLQATRYRKPIISYNPPPFFMQIANSKAYLPFTAPGGNTGADFSKNLAISPVRWGRSVSGSESTILFSPPLVDEPIVSLAQFQHADLTADDIYTSVAHQPGNAFGNSYATPFVTREKTVLNRTDYKITGYDAAIATATNYYDISYLLNASIWDTYFVSAIPAASQPVPLNPKIVKIDPSDTSTELRDGDKTSARLMINGAFNINSTSKDAWKAFLAGSKHLRHPADMSNSTDAMFPRSLSQISPSQTPPSGNDQDSFSGFRRLTDPQIDLLAEAITRQVRLRGPFLSLSHFINRSLVPLATDKDLGRSGALQSALDLSGANIKPDGTAAIFSGITLNEDKVTLKASGSGPSADLTGSAASSFSPASIWPTTSRDKNPGAVASILADTKLLTDPAYRIEQGFRSTGIPGWLTQADVLQVIGPSIAARSDTFKIRSYGEALDASGNVMAKAWCEAVVQRMPDYVDPSNKAYDRASLGSVNTTFGRKFNLVSFRWLTSDEI